MVKLLMYLKVGALVQERGFYSINGNINHLGFTYKKTTSWRPSLAVSAKIICNPALNLLGSVSHCKFVLICSDVAYKIKCSRVN